MEVIAAIRDVVKAQKRRSEIRAVDKISVIVHGDVDLSWICCSYNYSICFSSDRLPFIISRSIF